MTMLYRSLHENTTQTSAQGKLSRMQVEPLLKAMGSSVLDCGDEARAGSTMKLVGNFTFMGYVEMAAEAMALADKGGLPRSSVTSFLDRIFPGFVTKGGQGIPHSCSHPIRFAGIGLWLSAPAVSRELRNPARI